MIPYFSPGPYQLGPVKLHPFGFLVGLAILAGIFLARRHAARRRLDLEVLDTSFIWACVVGFCVSHWVDLLLYFPERLDENPMEFFLIWRGISSFGGFLGGYLGISLYLRYKKVPQWPYFDAYGYGFSFSWILGRLGCTFAHGHPGRISDFVLAVRYPADPVKFPDIVEPADPMIYHSLPDVSRHDLGFYELLFAIVLASFLFLTNRRAQRFVGYNLVVMALAYAPVRFGLDFLRVGDKRYFGLTPAQLFAVGLFAFGVWMLITRRRAAGSAPAERRARQSRSPTGPR